MTGYAVVSNDELHETYEVYEFLSIAELELIELGEGYHIETVEGFKPKE